MKISFVVFGQPVAKARHRGVRRGNTIATYTPKNTATFGEYVKLVAAEHKPKELLKGAIKLALAFYLQRPKSLPKKVLYNTKKPDIDNLQKAVMDALEAIIYERDSQIVDLCVTKRYGEPRVEITIEEI